jgi:hypothetical protein
VSTQTSSLANQQRHCYSWAIPSPAGRNEPGSKKFRIDHL